MQERSPSERAEEPRLPLEQPQAPGPGADAAPPPSEPQQQVTDRTSAPEVGGEQRGDAGAGATAAESGTEAYRDDTNTPELEQEAAADERTPGG